MREGRRRWSPWVGKGREEHSSRVQVLTAGVPRWGCGSCPNPLPLHASPFAPFPLALPPVSVAENTHALPRLQFQQAAACAEQGGCRDRALSSQPVAPVRAHIAAGSIALAPSCRLSLSPSSTLLFGQAMILYMYQAHLSSSLLLFVSRGAIWHRLSSQKATTGSSVWQPSPVPWICCLVMDGGVYSRLGLKN